tara:strand:+ start:1447 stop:2619 length:1173 start_codon:yes stop_codon:yes gene_type:complete
MKNFLYRSLIAPFTSVERSILYLCTFFGQFGFTGLLVYFAFDLASMDLKAVLGFFSGKFIFSNLFFLPMLFIIVQRSKTPLVFMALVITQLLAMAALFYNKDLFNSGIFGDTFFVGVILSFVTEPFWVIYHYLMLKLTSAENRGHEVSVAELGLQIGSAVGALGAGMMLTFMPGYIFPIFAGFLMIVPTSLLSILSTQNFEPPSAAEAQTSFLAPYIVLFQQWRLSLATIMQGVLEGLTVYYAPLWMKLLGFSAIIMSSLTSAKLIARILISPLTGHLFEKKNREELKLGSAIYIISWLPWLVLSNAVSFIISSVLWSLYNHLIKVGLDGRWYDNQTMDGMATREVAMGIGRVLALLTVAPLIIISPFIFFIGAIGAGFVFLATSYVLKK